MGMIFHALDDRVQMFVDNPGHGEVVVVGFTDDEDTVSISGPRLGRLLEETTRRALGAQPQEHSVLPRSVTTVQAGQLLPLLQGAVLLAVAGTDRYERVEPDPDEKPPDVLCATCGQGSVFHQEVTISEKCNQHGHTPFGYPTGTTWAQAHALAGVDQRWWLAGRSKT